MQEERISVGPKEQKRALALNRLLAGDWTEGETAVALGLSVRQVRRLKRAYGEEGISSLIHGNRGRRPHDALADEIRGQVLTLARTTYAGCNDHPCVNCSQHGRDSAQPVVHPAYSSGGGDS